jgi:hypothetical protein
MTNACEDDKNMHQINIIILSYNLKWYNKIGSHSSYKNYKPDNSESNE